MSFSLNRLFLAFLFIGLAFNRTSAQTYIQYSGVIVATDSSKPVSYATVYDITNGNGAYANYQGFFSLVVSPGDSVLFTSIGFAKHFEIVPRNANSDKYSEEVTIQPMSYTLPQTTIYPYPTRDEFRYAFEHLNIPDDDLARAKKNLSPEVLMALIRNAPTDPEINQMRMAQNYSSSLYYIGEYKPINLLNPLAWAQFFEAIKNGELKSPGQ